MVSKYNQLLVLGNPHYALYAPLWILHFFRALVWSVTLAFFFWGVPDILEKSDSTWVLWIIGVILLLLSGGLAMPASFQPMINFACDTTGVFVFYAPKKYAFIPWENVRNIRIDRIIGSSGGSQTGLVVEAKVADPYISKQLFSNYFVSGKIPVDESGFGRLGISNNCRSMTSAMHEINRIRRLAGMASFPSGNRNKH